MNIPEQVAPAYEYWQKFLKTQITFWLKTSDKHTKEYCKRVLLYCLLIADQKNCLQRNGISSVLLYQIFKDADALDRFRLGPGGFDSKYLRTNEARKLVEYAKAVWKECCSKER